MSLILTAVVLSTVHLEGDALPGGGDFIDVPFTVPAGTVEIQIKHADDSSYDILDWGVWQPEGYRGWAGGLTDDAIIGVEQSSRSYLPGPITPGTWTLVIGKAQLDADGTHYTLDIVCRDNATLTVLPKAAYTPVVLAHERRWYKGDFHVHSTESGDAMASFAEIETLAKSRGLDFVNISDHNTVSQHAQIAAVQSQYPDFLFLRGAEITTYSGHANAVGIHEYVEHRLGYMGRTVAGITADVAAQGGILLVNHPVLDLGTACIGCAWKHLDDTPWDQVAGMELSTGNYEIGVQVFIPRAIELWNGLVMQGYNIAAVGGSDDHRAGRDTGSTASEIGTPTTMVLADELSEAAIIDAIRKGHTVVKLRAPDDPMVELQIPRGDGTFAEIGDIVGEAPMDVHVTGGAGTFVQVWIDGAKATQIPVTSDDFHTTYDFGGSHASGGQGAAPLPWHVRAELINDTNQRLVVTSHLRVVPGGGDDSGGCGCRTGGGSGGAMWLLVGGVWLLRGQRRRRAT
jgi:MYXO-CTERM domain-containing protein